MNNVWKIESNVLNGFTQNDRNVLKGPPGVTLLHCSYFVLAPLSNLFDYNNNGLRENCNIQFLFFAV